MIKFWLSKSVADLLTSAIELGAYLTIIGITWIITREKKVKKHDQK